MLIVSLHLELGQMGVKSQSFLNHRDILGGSSSNIIGVIQSISNSQFRDFLLQSLTKLLVTGGLNQDFPNTVVCLSWKYFRNVQTSDSGVLDKDNFLISDLSDRCNLLPGLHILSRNIRELPYPIICGWCYQLGYEHVILFNFIKLS